MVGRSSRNRGINYAILLLEIDPDLEWGDLMKRWMRNSAQKIRALIDMLS